MHVAGRDVDRAHQLPLILTEGFLVKGVRNLKEVARQIKIQVQRIFRRGIIIEPVKEAGSSSLVV